jgi:hypothetical protein
MNTFQFKLGITSAYNNQATHIGFIEFAKWQSLAFTFLPLSSSILPSAMT